MIIKKTAENKMCVRKNRTFIGVEFPNELLSKVDALKTGEDRQRSSMIRILVIEALRARGVEI